MNRPRSITIPPVLKYRLIFGPIMILAALGLFWLDGVLGAVALSEGWQWLALGQTHLPPGILMLVFFVALIWLAMRELQAVLQAKGVNCSRWLMSLAATVALVLIWIMPDDFNGSQALALYATAIGLILMAALIQHSWGGKVAGSTTAAAAVLLAMVYLGVLPGFFLAARSGHSAWVILFVILITKSCDIGAYFTGRAIGKHKLIPWLSPGKTWEGLIGGLFFSALLAVGLVTLANQANIWAAPGSAAPGSAAPGSRTGAVALVGDAAAAMAAIHQIPLWFAALGGVLLGGIGQLGDLTASLFKRDAGIKDSGAAVPGFGGLLDIMDSPILVAPVGYWLLALAADPRWWS